MDVAEAPAAEESLLARLVAAVDIRGVGSLTRAELGEAARLRGPSSKNLDLAAAGPEPYALADAARLLRPLGWEAARLEEDVAKVERSAAVFRSLDASQSGFLELKELRAALTAQAGHALRLAGLVSTLDSARNGKVSWLEFLAGVTSERFGERFAPFRDWALETAPLHIFSDIDIDVGVGDEALKELSFLERLPCYVVQATFRKQARRKVCCFGLPAATGAIHAAIDRRERGRWTPLDLATKELARAAGGRGARCRWGPSSSTRTTSSRSSTSSGCWRTTPSWPSRRNGRRSSWTTRAARARDPTRLLAVMELDDENRFFAGLAAAEPASADLALELFAAMLVLDGRVAGHARGRNARAWAGSSRSLAGTFRGTTSRGPCATASPSSRRAWGCAPDPPAPLAPTPGPTQVRGGRAADATTRLGYLAVDCAR
ncbi:hypothetical protein SO694_00004531 [Aureococcus anophagefferens]|uniref:EF-hand domain-containing protein n=1 Tax=Aureococcus anophagefferens TaxID=44056 RepID=A0ABR1G9C4_AURAN